MSTDKQKLPTSWKDVMREPPAGWDLATRAVQAMAVCYDFFAFDGKIYRHSPARDTGLTVEQFEASLRPAPTKPGLYKLSSVVDIRVNSDHNPFAFSVYGNDKLVLSASEAQKLAQLLAPPPLQWTREKPSQDGWYYIKQLVGGGHVSLRKIKGSGVYSVLDAYYGELSAKYPGCLWAGPIQEPLPVVEPQIGKLWKTQIVFSCPECGNIDTIDDPARGTRRNCVHCTKELIVP